MWQTNSNINSVTHYSLCHSSLLISFNIYSKYLNSETCSNSITFTKTSHTDSFFSPNTITLLISAFPFRPFLLHTSRKHLIIQLFFNSPHSTKSFTCKRLSNLPFIPPLKSHPHSPFSNHS